LAAEWLPWPAFTHVAPGPRCSAQRLLSSGVNGEDQGEPNSPWLRRTSRPSAPSGGPCYREFLHTTLASQRPIAARGTAIGDRRVTDLMRVAIGHLNRDARSVPCSSIRARPAPVLAVSACHAIQHSLARVVVSDSPAISGECSGPMQGFQFDVLDKHGLPSPGCAIEHKPPFKAWWGLCPRSGETVARDCPDNNLVPAERTPIACSRHRSSQPIKELTQLTTPSQRSLSSSHPGHYLSDPTTRKTRRPVEPASTRRGSRVPHPPTPDDKINKGVGRGSEPDDHAR
jgi:hypothetical protein